MNSALSPCRSKPWNLGKLIGQKPPLKLREVWAIRIRLQLQERLRDLAMLALICRRTGNLRAVQLLLGHTRLESTVRYLGIEVDDALAISEQVDI